MLKEEDISIQRNTKSYIKIIEMLIDSWNKITKKTENFEENHRESKKKIKRNIYIYIYISNGNTMISTHRFVDYCNNNDTEEPDPDCHTTIPSASSKYRKRRRDVSITDTVSMHNC